MNRSIYPIVRFTVAAFALAAGGYASFAQVLPGLPAATMPAGGQPRPVEIRPLNTQTSTAVRGSLFKQGAVAAGPGEMIGQQPADSHNRAGASISFTSVPSPESRRYKKNDIVTVIVREDSNAKTDGKGSSNKSQEFDVALEQFLQLALTASGIPTVGTVGNPGELPEIKFKYDNSRQNDAKQERQDSFSARISAIVVDVKPNGTMVLEATKQIVMDKEELSIKLSGICRVEDIAVDNTVLSTQLADLTVSKQTKGQVHDTNKRGWLNRLIDQFSAF